MVNPNQNVFQIKFEAMGTNLEIAIWDKLSEVAKSKIKLEILDFTEKFDRLYSRFRKDSLIWRIYESGVDVYKVTQDLSRDLIEMLKIYKTLNEMTDGAVNPFVGNTISDLGYDEKYTLRPKGEIRVTPNWQRVINSENMLNFTGFLELREKVLIDIGAIGKGFWVDKVCEILRKNNCKKFLVNGSGDMYYENKLDREKLKIKLENTSDEWELFNESLCGSGTDVRNWSINEGDNLHHVINANTNLPTNGVQNTWVKISNCVHKYPTTFCDGLATALFFKSAEEIKQKLSINFESLVR